MRKRTHDDAGLPANLALLTNEQIGPKRHLTREGYLLCLDVPIARIGTMMYAAGETPIKVGDNGIALIERGETDLFSPRTILSFVGKSLTDSHPYDGVHPLNHRHVTVGTAHNVRRGTGDDADVLLADLLITDAETIRKVQAGLVEVSAGYDADYEQTGPGEGRQFNIEGNHIALVPTGRCGPRCAIGDQLPSSLPPTKGKTMPQASATRLRKVVPAAIRKAVIDAANEAMEAAMSDPVLMNGNTPDEEGEGEGGGTQVHVHLHGASAPGMTGGAAGLNSEDDLPLPTEGGVPGAVAAPDAAGAIPPAIEARFGAIESMLAKIAAKVGAGAEPAAAEGGPPAAKAADEMPDDADEFAQSATADSTALETSFKALLVDAEVIHPGFAVPTFDAKATRKATVDSMCAQRRRVLDAACITADGRGLVEGIAGTPAGKHIDLATMDCAAVAGLFRSVAAAKRVLNNRATVGDGAGKTGAAHEAPAKKGPMTLAELNAQNRKHYGNEAVA